MEVLYRVGITYLLIVEFIISNLVKRDHCPTNLWVQLCYNSGTVLLLLSVIGSCKCNCTTIDTMVSCNNDTIPLL